MCAGLKNASNGATLSPNCEDFAIVIIVRRTTLRIRLRAQWLVVVARCATGMSSSNPKPRDLNKAVVVVDGDEMRLRRADEQTEAGQEVEHHLFIVCVNIGVRTMGELSTHYTRTMV